jgi:hypothetical protein
MHARSQVRMVQYQDPDAGPHDSASDFSAAGGAAAASRLAFVACLPSRSPLPLIQPTAMEREVGVDNMRDQWPP